MKNLNLIASELFNKVRGRFPSITLGTEDGKVTNQPDQARYFDFEYKEGDKILSRVSISLTEESLQVMYTEDFVANEDQYTQDNWYNFLKELRRFSKKRLLNFDTRNITKTNLDRRDYSFLVANRGENNMNESKLYGTSKQSYQNIGDARIAIRHSKPINQDFSASRTQNISKIYVESPDGERFLYPYKHLNGARAMARHVSEGGKPYDDFGNHIAGLSEEAYSLRKFKNYMNRSSVMAEGLNDYLDIVVERMSDIKSTLQQLQKENYYKETIEGFEKPIVEDVPEDVKENWIDQLTVRQFNEELKDVFPYIYRLVSEGTRAQTVDLEDIVSERNLPMDIDGASAGNNPIHFVRKGDTVYSLAQAYDVSVEDVIKANNLDQEANILPGQQLVMPMSNTGKNDSNEEIENVFDEMMGQFAEGRDDSPEGDRITTDENPLITSYDDEFKQGEPQISGHMNLKTYMSIIGISEEYQDMLAQAVIEAGVGKKISVPDEVKADYDDERAREDLKPRALWIELSQHHEAEKESDATAEGNKFSKELDKARKNGDDEMEIDGKKIPVTEFILSMYDRETGQFPKGETAILTAVEKDYGEQYITPAKEFIEAINAKFEEINGYKDPELMDDDNLDNLITTGVKGSYDFISKSIKDFEELIKNNPNHPKVPQVKAELAKLKPMLAQARKDSEMEDLTRLAGL